MKIHHLSGSPPDSLVRPLEEFERPFRYPLGSGTSFRISHGKDYCLFFRAQGEACCFIAEHQGQVVGSLGTVLRRLRLPDGKECSVAYFGDLKVAAQARGGTVLIRLARAADAWVRPRVQAAFGVVMGGTSQTPDAYTGRAGIPGFHAAGRLAILRLTNAGAGGGLDTRRFLAGNEAGLACFRSLNVGRYVCDLGQPALRSQITPVWLVHPDGSACGLLEDTRKAKRLISDDGQELLSAHLSCFAYNSVSAAAELLRVALIEAARSNLPALFVAVPDAEVAALCRSVPSLNILTAPATVYGAGLPPGLWNINSSEI